MIWRRDPATPDGYSLDLLTEAKENLIQLEEYRPAAAAMVLVRQFTMRGIPTPFKLAYTPKGPLLDWGVAGLRTRVLADLTRFAKQTGALLLKIDPDVRLGTGIPGSPDAADDKIGQEVENALTRSGWSFSRDQIQFRNTVLLNLETEEEDLLKRMKQKTRYNIRLAARKGVEIRRGTRKDFDLLYRLYAETAVRDKFIIRSEAYYHNLWTTFMQNSEPGAAARPAAVPLIAEVGGEAVAAVILFHFAKRAWFLFGMSGDTHRKLMPNYLLQWEAMKYAKSAGCTHYDMWGAPDQFNESDSLWGVFRFKQGFQGEVIRTLGAWDLPLRPLQHRLFSRLLPAVLDRMRRRGKSKTEQLVAPL
jgi:lipid II:glycine glycyltransferase (peptidoglycan interpeptide bridge formation enzyme)